MGLGDGPDIEYCPCCGSELQSPIYGVGTRGAAGQSECPEHGTVDVEFYNLPDES